MLVVAAGAALLARIGVGSDFATGVLPGMLVLSIGLGAVMVSGLSTSTLGVAPDDAGAAGAMANTSQQIGSAIGLALLSTLAATAGCNFLHGKSPSPDVLARAAIHRYSAAFWWAAAIFAASAVICGTLMRGGVSVIDPDAAPVPA